MPKPNQRRSLKRILSQFVLLLLIAGASFSAVIFLQPASTSAADLKVGDVSGQDIQAPYPITYNSDVLTEALRQSMVLEVSPRYTSVDTNIARQQLERLRLAIAYINSVRADTYSDLEEKAVDLAALQDIQLSQDTVDGILALSDTRWQTIQQEAISVLEQIMRNTIRDTQVETYRQSVINLVSLAIPAEQAAIVAELAAAFVAPNSVYSESLTDSAKQNAYDSVPPVSVSYVTGETIVRRGEKVTAENIEALQKYGLAETEISWQDYASAGLLVVLSVSLIIIFLRRGEELRRDIPSLTIIAIFFIIFLVVARLVLPTHPLSPYLYPMAAYALIIGCLFGAEAALVTVIPLIILSTYGHGNAFELFLYYGIGSIFGVLIPRQEQRISGYIWVGLSVTASGVAVITIYRLLDSETTGLTLLTLLAVALINGVIAAGFTVLIQSVIAPLLGQTTPLQLLELSRPDHPLLEHLLRNAPGTYQHSLQVANLAEQAAERIGADSLLTRVGALYHDIGKSQNAQFFIENQLPGQLDTHDHLDPEQSARIIIQHVTSGLEMAKKHKLPRRIQQFISEHHGTFKTNYQWTQAVNAVQGDTAALNVNDFQYSGPRPQSRETALVMLADGCEARVRAKRPPNEAEMKTIIKDTFDNCLSSGQLDDTPLTLQNLTTIMDSFAATLKGVYHPRVEYPTLDVPTVPTSSLEDDELNDHRVDTKPAQAGNDRQLIESNEQPTVFSPKVRDDPLSSEINQKS